MVRSMGRESQAVNRVQQCRRSGVSLRSATPGTGGTMVESNRNSVAVGALGENMTIIPQVEVQEIRAGFAARNNAIGLVGHGLDQERAIANLASAVAIWARCLTREGILDQALRNRGVNFREDGNLIRIEPVVGPVSY